MSQVNQEEVSKTERWWEPILYEEIPTTTITLRTKTAKAIWNET